ncbi:MAG: hypothetical protein OEW12_03050 [Deltaproteobacteria bacterium]|nr:hypothetical protein [Deltaproteobacteria bacterium]
MEFENVIKNAGNLFLFDRLSQQQLFEMAESARKGTRDYALIKLTQAAFGYYNALDDGGVNLEPSILQALGVVQEVREYQGDRAFDALASKMEVDMLLHLSYLKTDKTNQDFQVEQLLQEEDLKALAICQNLLKQFPVSFDPLPQTWYTSLIPLLPPFKTQVLSFYKDRVTENRILHLTDIFKHVKQEIITAEGVILAKRFLTENQVMVESPAKLKKILSERPRRIAQLIRENTTGNPSVASDIKIPTGIGTRHLNDALTKLEELLKSARQKRDAKTFTGHLLHGAILHFLRGDWAANIKSLVQTLRSSRTLSKEDRKVRMHRHEEFSDIPFMVGTSFLELGLSATEDRENQFLFSQARVSLLQTLALNPAYHQAYVNLILTMGLLWETSQTELEELAALYLKTFQNHLGLLHHHFFTNLAVLDAKRSGQTYSVGMAQWLFISQLSGGGELTEGKKMLQELKTLYVLNAHEVAGAYLNTYRHHVRMENPVFMGDIQDDLLHSAILFYIAHALTYLSIKQGQEESDLELDFDRLKRAIETTTESLFFNRKNSSAIRLVETQSQLLTFVISRLERKWERIKQHMSQRFQMYEDYLRLVKIRNVLNSRLMDLGLHTLTTDSKLSLSVVSKIEMYMSSSQRERIEERVNRLR